MSTRRAIVPGSLRCLQGDPPRVNGAAVALLLASALLACGEGPADPAQPFVKQLASTGPATRQTLAQTASASSQTPSPKAVFDWAEYQYAALFTPAGTEPDRAIEYQGARYTIRGWPNGNYLGVTPDGGIWGLGPFTGQVLTSFGNVADYAARIDAERCIYEAGHCMVAGTARTLALGVQPAGALLTDSGSGLRFGFPAGASGGLRLAPLTSTSPAPGEGRGWRIESDPGQTVEVVLDGAFDGSASMPAVYRFQNMPSGMVVDDGRGEVPRWMPVPVRQIAPGRYGFDIGASAAPPAASQQALDRVGPPRLANDTSTISREYWIGQQEKGSSENQKRVAQQQLALRYVDDFLAALPPALAAQVRTRRTEKLWSWTNDGNWYRGFTYFSSALPTRHPMLAVTFDNASLAHEVGHYLTHMLVGDAAYQRLESQAYPVRRWWVPGSQDHGIGMVVGRGLLNEDYAYFVESFLIGKGGNYDLFNPRVMLGARPGGEDTPGMEGFTALMLASLVRTTSFITSIDVKDRLVEVPVMGWTYAQVFERMAAGRTSVDDLRRHIESALDDTGRQKFYVNLQRLGWRYASRLRLVDVSGQPVANADVRLVSRIGSTEYLAETARSDAAGNLNTVFAFPGATTLAVRRGSETLEGTITIDPDLPVGRVHALGDVKVCPAPNGCADKSVYQGTVEFGHSWVTGKIEFRVTGLHYRGESFSGNPATGTGGRIRVIAPRVAPGQVATFQVEARLKDLACHAFFPKCAPGPTADSWRVFGGPTFVDLGRFGNPVTLQIDSGPSCQRTLNFEVPFSWEPGVASYQDVLQRFSVAIEACG